MKYIQSDRHGKNALDFHIAFYMGRLLEGLEANGTPTSGNTRFVVISHDGGFDALISHVQSHGYRVDDAPETTAASGRPDANLCISRIPEFGNRVLRWFTIRRKHRRIS